MDVPTHAELITRIEQFCERHALAESTFGRLALGNSAFVGSLRDPGRSPTLETLNKLAAFMAEKDAELDPPGDAAPPTDDPGGGEDDTSPFRGPLHEPLSRGGSPLPNPQPTPASDTSCSTSSTTRAPLPPPADKANCSCGESAPSATTTDDERPARRVA
jgi:hypothetical protein